jgi:hypothetical protein
MIVKRSPFGMARAQEKRDEKQSHEGVYFIAELRYRDTDKRLRRRVMILLLCQ